MRSGQADSRKNVFRFGMVFICSIIVWFRAGPVRCLLGPSVGALYFCLIPRASTLGADKYVGFLVYAISWLYHRPCSRTRTQILFRLFFRAGGCWRWTLRVRKFTFFDITILLLFSTVDLALNPVT